MLSTPAPIPISIIPDLIALAMSTQAVRPEVHCLFNALRAVDVGKPAAIAAARNSVWPPPGGRTEPTAISSTRDGSIPDRSINALKAPWSISEGIVSLKPPFPALVIAVRRAHVITIYIISMNRFKARGAYIHIIVTLGQYSGLAAGCLTCNGREAFYLMLEVEQEAKWSDSNLLR
jgi:hypothetical protein